MLDAQEENRTLYLAVPLEAYKTFFQSRFAQTAIGLHQINLLVYNPVTEEIVEWIN